MNQGNEIKTAINQLKVGDKIFCIGDRHGEKTECTIKKIGNKYIQTSIMKISIDTAKLCSDGSLKFYASYGNRFYTNPDMHDLEKEAVSLKREIFNIIQSQLWDDDSTNIEQLRQVVALLKN